MADGNEQEQVRTQELLAAGGRAMLLYERAATALRVIRTLMDDTTTDGFRVMELIDIGLDKDLDKAAEPETRRPAS